jgi:hypothetical protein
VSRMEKGKAQVLLLLLLLLLLRVLLLGILLRRGLRGKKRRGKLANGRWAGDAAVHSTHWKCSGQGQLKVQLLLGLIALLLLAGGHGKMSRCHSSRHGCCSARGWAVQKRMRGGVLCLCSASSAS